LVLPTNPDPASVSKTFARISVEKFVSSDVIIKHTTYETRDVSNQEIEAGNKTLVLPGNIVTVLGEYIEEPDRPDLSITVAWSGNPEAQKRVFNELVSILGLKRSEPYGAEEAAAGHLFSRPGCDFYPNVRREGSDKSQTVILTLGTGWLSCKQQ
jgi:hypothetical protein